MLRIEKYFITVAAELFRHNSRPNVAHLIPEYLWADRKWIFALYNDCNCLTVFDYANISLKENHNYVLKCISIYIHNNKLFDEPTFFDQELFHDIRFVKKFIRAIKNSRNIIHNLVLLDFFKKDPNTMAPPEEQLNSYILMVLLSIIKYSPPSITCNTAIMRRMLKLNGAMLLFLFPAIYGNSTNVSLIKAAVKHTEFMPELLLDYGCNIPNELRCFALNNCCAMKSIDLYTDSIGMDMVADLIDREEAYMMYLDRCGPFIDISVSQAIFIHKFIKLQMSIPIYMKKLIDRLGNDKDMVLRLLKMRPEVILIPGFLSKMYKTDFNFMLSCMEFEPASLSSITDNEVVEFVLSGILQSSQQK